MNRANGYESPKEEKWKKDRKNLTRRLHSGEKKKRNMKIPAGWTEVKPNNNNINYMRHDLCKFIMANDCYAYDIHVEYP